MTTNNPLSGHTDGTNDGLKDGDHVLSPSLTNLYEGVHGNGILLPQDTAYSDSDRNDPPDLPGAISAGSAANQFVVKACDVILDGVLYAIGGGSDITVTLTTTTSQKLGTFTALTTNQECIFVVIATAEGLKVSQTTPITTASGAYASITGTAAAYLKTGGGAGENRQSVVLGTVRATRVTGSTVGDLNIQSLSEYNDKRVFVRPTPLYLSPVRDGNKTSTTGINGHTALSQVHGTGQHGTYGDNGVIWQSFNANNESMLYYSRKDGSNRHTHLLGPTNVNVLSTSSNQTFTFDSDQVFVITAGSTINLNPSGTFPPGHHVFVSVPSGSTLTFDSSGANVAIAAGSAVMFVYDGANWKTVLYSSTIATTSSGTSGLVQLSDGSGGFTSDTALSFNTSTNVLTVDGKLTVTGLIDPTGLVVDEKANTAATGHSSAAGKGLYWVKNDAPNRPMFTNDAGTEKNVLINGDNVSELTNDAGYVDASGAAAAAPATNLGYTASSRTVTSSTGTNAVITEVAAGGNSGLMTGADKTKLDGIATGATANAGTVTSVATTAPITGGTITSTGTIGISAATTSAAGSMSSADKTKLDGIEANADVTDAANVTAAGALMDSEVTNLAQVKAFASSDYATAAQGAKADSAQQPPSEGAFVNGDKTKLDGIDASADVTDATTVNAAGAVMESDVDAKGDIFVATADNTVTRLAVGTNNHVLTADSSEASGVKWAAASGGGSVRTVTAGGNTLGSGETLAFTEGSNIAISESGGAVTIAGAALYGRWEGIAEYDNLAEATFHTYPIDDSTNFSRSGSLTGFSSGTFTATASTAGTYMVTARLQYGDASSSSVAQTSGNKVTLQLTIFKGGTMVEFGRVQKNGHWVDDHFTVSGIVTLAESNQMTIQHKLVDHVGSSTQYRIKDGNGNPCNVITMVKIA